jgi:hypothetical protein
MKLSGCFNAVSSTLLFEFVRSDFAKKMPGVANGCLMAVIQRSGILARSSVLKKGSVMRETPEMKGF